MNDWVIQPQTIHDLRIQREVEIGLLATGHVLDPTTPMAPLSKRVFGNDASYETFMACHGVTTEKKRRELNEQRRQEDDIKRYLRQRDEEWRQQQQYCDMRKREQNERFDRGIHYFR